MTNVVMWCEPDSQDPVRAGKSTGSEVEVVSDMPSPEILARTGPSVATMNVTKSSRVHIGPKFVSITQNVDNAEMVKGRFLGLELVSPTKANRLRCSVAVFVCWAFVVAFGLSLYLSQVVIHHTRLDIGLNETWYLRRDDWQAMPQYELEFLKLPLKNVVIGHTGTHSCKQRYACIKAMLQVQMDNLQRGFKDIVPNFLVGGNGTIFEGRGANVQAAMIRSWNVKSITIMFIGDYRYVDPDPLQLEHVNILLRQLVREGVLEPDFVLYGQCQLAHDTITPGPRLLDRLDELMNYDPVDKNTCSRH